MKSYIDFFETLKGEFIGSLKFKNKFIRLWGITTIDGVEVLNPRFYLNPGFESKHVQSLLKHIGALKQFNSTSFRGTTSYYFYLNATKADTLSQENLNDIIASKINSYSSVGEKLIINLNFNSNISRDYFNGFTKQQIFDFVNNDYDTAYNTLDNYSVGDTLLISTIGTYILFDNNQHFTITLLDAVINSYPYREKLNSWNDEYTTVYKAGISLKIQAVRNTNVIGTSNIVTHVVDETNEFQKTKLQQLLESDTNESTSGSAWIKKRTKKTDDIWHNGNMRISFLNDNSISTKDKLKILISAIDTGYTTPKTKWWKKILGPVLIVLAIVIAVVTVGTGAPISTMLTAIAIAVGAATLTMTALSMYWGKHGDPGAAQYMGRWIKVGQIISVVAGLTAITINIARNAALQAATTSATETATATGTSATVTATSLGQTVTVTATVEVGAYGTTTAIVEGGTGALVSQTVSVGIGDFISAGWDSVYSGVAGSFQSAVSSGLKMVRFFTNMRFQSQAKSLQSEINSLTEQRDKSNKELEELNDKEVNIAVEDIKWYTSPLKLESQRYDVDYLYGGTRMNICRPSFITAKGLNIISNDIYDTNKI